MLPTANKLAKDIASQQRLSAQSVVRSMVMLVDTTYLQHENRVLTASTLRSYVSVNYVFSKAPKKAK